MPRYNTAVLTMAAILSLVFAFPAMAQSQTELKECRCEYTYYPKKEYKSPTPGKTEKDAIDAAWQNFADNIVGFNTWYRGLKNDAPKCPADCQPGDVSGPFLQSPTEDVKAVPGTNPAVYEATLTWQAKMTVTCAKQKVLAPKWF
jgi:hypothetical protein